MKEKPVMVLFGKLPPPYIGPAIATKILLESSLSEYYDVTHINTMFHSSIETFGKFRISRVFQNIRLYFKCAVLYVNKKPEIILLPVSQTIIGFIKDAPFIIMAKCVGARTIIQLRGSEFRDMYERTNWFMKIIVRNAMKNVDAAVVLGHRLRYIFDEFIKKENIYVIPNGANVAIDDNVIRIENRILYLSNLQASKGIEDVMDACEIMSRKHTSYELLVSGAWYEEHVLQKYHNIINNRKANIAYRGVCTSKVEKSQLLSSASIFVFTPRAPEGHPWVIIEAMAAGLPIVTTDKGAISESVLAGENGFIVPDRSPIAIAEKLELLLSDRSLRSAMGQKSRALYETLYTEDKMISNWRRVLDEVLSA